MKPGVRVRVQNTGLSVCECVWVGKRQRERYNSNCKMFHNLLTPTPAHPSALSLSSPYPLPYPRTTVTSHPLT